MLQMHKSIVLRVLIVGLTGLAVGVAPLSAHEAHEHEAHEPEKPNNHPEPHHTPDSVMPSSSAKDTHQHSSVEVPARYLMPTVNLVVHPDSRQGWNLEIQVTNFKLAPEHVNQPDEESTSDILEGHAHLYIDGTKITRLYGNWYYLESLPPGTHQISVSLNTNSHATLMHNGQPIQATVTLEAANQ
jgi:hypothetical protein